MPLLLPLAPRACECFPSPFSAFHAYKIDISLITLLDYPVSITIDNLPKYSNKSFIDKRASTILKEHQEISCSLRMHFFLAQTSF